MPYNFVYLDEKNYLQVSLIGDLEAPELSFIQDVNKKSVELSCFNFLIDVRKATNLVHVTKFMKTGYSLLKVHVSKQSKIAALYNKNQTNISPIFFETAKYLGYTTKIFTNKSHAEKWLQQDFLELEDL